MATLRALLAGALEGSVTLMHDGESWEVPTNAIVQFAAIAVATPVVGATEALDDEVQTEVVDSMGAIVRVGVVPIRCELDASGAAVRLCCFGGCQNRAPDSNTCSQHLIREQFPDAVLRLAETRRRVDERESALVADARVCGLRAEEVLALFRAEEVSTERVRELISFHYSHATAQER